MEHVTIRAEAHRHNECLPDRVYLCLVTWPLNAADKVTSRSKGRVTLRSDLRFDLKRG